MKKIIAICKFIRLQLNNIIIRLFFHKPKMNKKYYASICLIFKNEAMYLDEWIKYHLIVGFEHFYLYNNFSSDNYQKILKPYIEKGFVTLINWDKVAGQMSAYNNCLERFHDESDWILFADADEFIVPIKYDNVKDWLKKYEKFPCVLAFWKAFTSGGIIHEDYTIPLIERFTSCGNGLSLPKMFLNTHFIKMIKNFSMPHFARWKFFNKICPQYAQVFTKLNCNIENPEIQINHYYCKSLEYYINKKVPGGKADRTVDQYTIDDFFKRDIVGSSKNFAIFKFLIRLKTFKIEDYMN